MKPASRVEKINSKPDDAHQDGAAATVLTSYWRGPGDDQRFSAEHEVTGECIGCLVEWDDTPGVPVFVIANRIRPVGDR
jgi:hypothetical protein